jgi:L-ascorbate metabolism protein UlaG (beta-lactamase superfamily)
MEIQFYGANCIKITSKKTTLVIDDNLAKLGLKPVTSAKDIVLVTSDQIELPAETHFNISQPGEYEVSEISIEGIPARSHMDEEGKTSAIMYKIMLDDVRIGITGHVHPDLSDAQLEALGTVDILFVPVGGNGYTLDGIGAHKVIKDVEPKLVIPTHFADPKLNYEVPQAPLEESLKALAMEPGETLDVLKLKNFDLGEGSTKLIVLNRQ